jgi:hypothetical protein
MIKQRQEVAPLILHDALKVAFNSWPELASCLVNKAVAVAGQFHDPNTLVFGRRLNQDEFFGRQLVYTSGNAWLRDT